MNTALVPLLTEEQAQILNNAMPANLLARIGDRLKEAQEKTLYIQKVPVAADASTGINFTVEYGGELVDAWTVCTAANVSGTLGIRRSTTALTTLMTCAVIDVLTRNALVLQSGKTLTQEETLNVKANGAADRGIVYMAILRS